MQIELKNAQIEKQKNGLCGDVLARRGGSPYPLKKLIYLNSLAFNINALAQQTLIIRLKFYLYFSISCYLLIDLNLDSTPVVHTGVSRSKMNRHQSRRSV